MPYSHDQAIAKLNLTPKQRETLLILFKYRYVSVPSLARYLNRSESTIKRMLYSLCELNLVTQRYPSNFKIQGKPAIYYLTTLGVSYIDQKHHVDKRAVSAMIKNQYVALEFMEKHILLIEIAWKAGVDTQVFTRYELLRFDSFPPTHPDLYVVKEGTAANQFIYFANLDNFIFWKKLLDELLEHFNDDIWQEDLDEPYPAILLICSSPRMEKRLNLYVEKVLDSTGIADLDISVSTVNATVTT